MVKNWEFTRLGILFLVFVSHGLCSCWSLNDEGLALLKIRERVVSDPFGALKNWKNIETEIDDQHHCSWFGVECSDGKVVILNLKDLCLEGTLAPEFRSLVHIKSIDLRNNSFHGIIPEGFGELKELEVFDMGYNNFSGPLPSDLGINLSLAILLLDNNELLGSLSPEIRELQIVSESQVDENQLSNVAKRKPSCSKGFITRNGVQNGNAVHRRLLEGAVRPLLLENAESPHLIDPSRSPSPSPSSQSALPPAAVSPSEPKTNQITSTPNVSASPSPISAPSPPSLNPTSAHHISSPNNLAIYGGSIGGAVFVFILLVGIYLCRSNKVATVKPWATGLSGQLQKAFVTGVPKLKRSELEYACEDFSNVIMASSPIGKVYKGTLSSGVEIAVASVSVKSAKDWSKNLEMRFREKIDMLSKVNHKNFVNLIGYCEEDEPFTRMMVFEYAPNGTLFEHIHIRESEHLDWGMRLRIAMGMAYCLEHMHQLNPPIPHNYLNSSAVSLTEDYAAKLSDLSFGNEIAPSGDGSKRLSNPPSATCEDNLYCFGVLLFEMMTGRLPYVVDNGSIEDWASDYLSGDRPLKEMVDPTLNSFDEEQVGKIDELIKACVDPNPRQRLRMREVTARLREITGITPDGAIPKLSPVWWAELEIMSTEAV